MKKQESRGAGNRNELRDFVLMGGGVLV